MPPEQQLRPPIVVAVANDNDIEEGGGVERKTHIEVCVRLRPLHVAQHMSARSFFHKEQPRQRANRKTSAAGSNTFTSPSRSLPRKPQIPRAPSSRSAPKTPPPLSPPPRRYDESTYAWKAVSDDTMTQTADLVPGRTHSYTLDKVYGPEALTEELYENSVQSLVHAAMDGYHTSVLAYGQTSTGKTHSMSGTAENPGLIPLAIQDCFDYLQRQDNDAREYLLRLSYLEVYKEHIRDLLLPTPKSSHSLSSTSAPPPVRLFERADGSLVIKGLTEQVVTSPEQVFEILAQGEARRQVGATNLNQHSSRSHVIVRLWIESRGINNASNNNNTSSTSNSRPSTPLSPAMSMASSVCSDYRGVRISSLSLVDLAGSESIRLTGATDRLRQEGQYINKSLSALGKVVYALSEGEQQQQQGAGQNSKKHQHIPYRDSKLTRLLQPSLSGKAQVVLICCISPLLSHIEESHNTFKFATRAKKIPQRAEVQESLDEKTLLQSYREEIEDLKQQLKEAREQQERLMKNASGSENNGPATPTAVLTGDDFVDEDEIGELVKSIQTMEKLILKSSSSGGGNKSLSPAQPEDLLDATSDTFSDDDMAEEEGLLALVAGEGSVATPTSRGSADKTTPSRDTSTDRDLHAELTRVQSILSSVMKKRNDISSRSDSNEEVRNLRAQLEQQEVASSLRKADSSFLQSQLEEKDKLLQEVSKLLEAVEERQTRLEEENAALRKELSKYRND